MINLAISIINQKEFEESRIKVSKKEFEMIIYLIKNGRKMKGGEITICYHNLEPDKIKKHFDEIKLGLKPLDQLGITL